MSSESRPLAGIVSMVTAVCCFSSMDTLGKELVGRYPVLEVLALRSLAASVLLLGYFTARSRFPRLRTRRPFLQVLRGGISIGTMLSFFFAVRGLPLAEATAICFGAPLLMTALSVPLLGERVGPRRWAAIGTGFLGVLVVTAPGSVHFSVHTLFALAASVQYAVLMVTTRLLREESTESMVAWVIFTQAAVAGTLLPFVWTPVDAADTVRFAGMAVLNLGGFVFLTRAFQCAAVSVVAPFEYVALLSSSLLGFLVFGEVPANRVFLGGALIVACGIAVILFEQQETRRRLLQCPAGADTADTADSGESVER